LAYLPHVLKVVESQDYPSIDLLVSDNGMNGTAVPAIVKEHYRRPYRFRQNPSTVSGSRHYNQLIDNADGEYVVILADDDEVSPNFISDLIRLLERHPEASVALAMEEVIDESGNVMRTSRTTVPEKLSGTDFIRATWKTREYGFEALCTFLAKTEKLRACGGFPDIWAATSDEDLLMVKLCLDSSVVFSTRCSFRKRFDEASQGYSIEPRDLARGIREFVTCLDSDPTIKRYSLRHPEEWSELRGYLVNSAWDTYYYRWASMYQRRLPPTRWVAAAFALPFQQYGKAVASTFYRNIKAKIGKIPV
jgi:glycosyltransferase involved in cell wall biosynthesis